MTEEKGDGDSLYLVGEDPCQITAEISIPGIGSSSAGLKTGFNGELFVSATTLSTRRMES